jgi:hypothetical protein
LGLAIHVKRHRRSLASRPRLAESNIVRRGVLTSRSRGRGLFEAIVKRLSLKEVILVLGLGNLLHLLYHFRPIIAKASKDATLNLESHQSPLLKFDSNGIHGFDLQKDALPLLYFNDTELGGRHACGKPKKQLP